LPTIEKLKITLNSTEPAIIFPSHEPGNKFVFEVFCAVNELVDISIIRKTEWRMVFFIRITGEIISLYFIVKE
jgi:hypothetical protein